MKTTLIILIIFIFLSPAFPQTQSQEKHVARFITDWHNAAARVYSDANFGAIEERCILCGFD